jgi:hypothetical protein
LPRGGRPMGQAPDRPAKIILSIYAGEPYSGASQPR